MSGRLACFLTLSLMLFFPAARAAAADVLVFQGTVLTIAPMPQVELSCGVLAPVSLMQFKVENVFVGDYKSAEILVDVLACGSYAPRNLKPGDKVLSVVRRVKRIPGEHDPLGLRAKSGELRKYFWLVSVGLVAYGPYEHP